MFEIVITIVQCPSCGIVPNIRDHKYNNHKENDSSNPPAPVVIRVTFASHLFKEIRNSVDIT